MDVGSGRAHLSRARDLLGSSEVDVGSGPSRCPVLGTREPVRTTTPPVGHISRKRYPHIVAARNGLQDFTIGLADHRAPETLAVGMSEDLEQAIASHDPHQLFPPECAVFVAEEVKQRVVLWGSVRQLHDIAVEEGPYRGGPPRNRL